jgi:hypothetical protein
MTIDTVQDRAVAASRWQAAKETAAAWGQANADLRRDQRVSEAQASAAARPRPQDRAADQPPPRQRAPQRKVDVKA